ncbi:DUF6708 domain-containing protein [Pseudoduganella umbonata]|uniref:DUF6708 domain-containing protein n=1 Tax=Pseudoduganella umbonata TaxID=864828 RepID=A0A4P8HU17_9BURK|nr:DUF6708 domain-containing protein [Pseudoduganella umbonata]MBB3225235.1 hypothetical protein [Pseudoduganella umbonata]QCP12252.1 hypothetical protein FCL38_18880 [Pseudoduganella umbonata]
MDDRIFGAKLGKPIPAWDLAHRLPVSGWVGPHIKEDGTTFRINSVYLDATDQSHMIRQWYAGGVLMAIFAVCIHAWLLVAMLLVSSDRLWPNDDILSISMVVVSMLGFGIFAIWFGKGEFFARNRYPIRFNRKTRKIYALIRPSRGESVHRNEDCIEEIEWSERTIFCIHRASQDGYHYWIRYYRVDINGNVEKAVTLGRDWEGIEGLEGLLGQWNYWCWYMNKGPVDLPKPGLFLAEQESMYESFLYCVYEMGFRASPSFRLLLLPVFLLLASHRVLSLWTCSSPRWPSEIITLCSIDPDDPFDEPTGLTPIGWHPTDLAVQKGKFPDLLAKDIEDWNGEPDAKKNALRWAEGKFAMSDTKQLASSGNQRRSK